MTDEQRQIWHLIRESNRAWMEGALHELADLFDEGAVLVAPGLKGRVEGRDAIVRSYESYIHHARTDAFEELEHGIDVFGDLAVATYRFSVRYTLSGEDKARDETGQEVLVLRRSAGRWKIVWRTQARDAIE